GAGDRWRNPDQRFRGRSAAPRRNPALAHYRSARLRRDRHSAGSDGAGAETDALRAHQHRSAGPSADSGMTCPICKKVEVSAGDPEFPFCSERCRTIDLGNWALEKYKISAPATAPPDEGED